MKLILTLALSLFLFGANSQDSLSRNFRTIRVYGGLPYQQVYGTNIWYEPDFELGIDIHHSFRLKNAFFASIGIGLNHSRMRTAPFTLSWTTYNFSPWQGVSNVQHFTENFQRQTMADFTTVRIPVRLEYMPRGKWRPYLKAGVMLDALFYSRSRDVYAHTSQPVPATFKAGKGYISAQDYLLSTTISGGLKYENHKIAFLVGLRTQASLYSFNSYTDRSRLSIGGEVSLRTVISNGIAPNIGSPRKNSPRKSSSRYVYLEGLGSGLLGSFNLEQTLVRRKRIRLNQRIGLGLVELGETVYSVPIGFSLIIGQKHAFEVGVNITPVLGDKSLTFFAPNIGYRAEIFQRFFMRASVVGWLFTSKYLNPFIVPGLSVGARF